jgi:hypothetical protein
MRRGRVIFVTAVFTALATGWLVQRANLPEKSFAETFAAAPAAAELPPLASPFGACRLTGTIREDDGDPAAEATLFLYERAIESGSVAPIPWTTTDAQGRFTIDGLPAGTFEALVIAPFTPVLRVPEVALVLPLAAGEGLNVEWTLPAPYSAVAALPEIRRGPFHTRLSPPVGFTIEDWPVADYEIALLPSPENDPLCGAVVRRGTVDVDGNLTLDEVVAAAYRVEVLPPWARGGSWPVLDSLPSFAHEADPGAPVSLSMRLRCGELTGRLIDAEGRSVEGAWVEVWPVQAGESSSRAWPVTTSDAQGVFHLRDLPPDAYLLRVRAGAARIEREVRVDVGARVEVELEPLVTAGG